MFTPPPAAGKGPRPGPPKPLPKPAPTRKAVPKGKPPATTRHGSPATPADEEAGDGKPRRRRQLEFAGLPIAAWIALIGGLIAAIVLGVLVFMQYG